MRDMPECPAPRACAAPVTAWLLLGTLCALPTGVAGALEATQFNQLTVLSDVHIARMMVDSVAWLGDERGLVAGGWEEWPTRPSVLVAPARGTPAVLQRTATSRFAVAPGRHEIAYWIASAPGWAQLAVAPLSGGPGRYVGDARRLSHAMHLAWPTDTTVCALVQDRATSTALAINTATGAARPLLEVQGGEWSGLRVWPGFDPIAVWIGDTKKCFRLSPLGRSEEISADFDADRARPTALYYSFFDETGALWIGGLGGRGPVKIAEDASAACWAPDESMLLFARQRELRAVRLPGLDQRTLAGSALESAGPQVQAPAGMACSGDGAAIAYWQHEGTSGHLRRAVLGTEEVTVQVRFDKGVTAAVGQRLWVARKLQVDKQGRVTGPVWSTLKGEFAVRRVAPGAKETLIQAVSVGAMAGVLTRLAGRPEPESGAVPESGPAQFSLKPLPGLLVWLQGTRHVGTIVSIEVRRIPLAARG